MKRFYYTNEAFFLNGKEITIISGTIHYFRVPKMHWHDRLLKLKECGFNCVETYVAWNLHEPEESTFCFDGELDIAAFIDEANALGLMAIVRPGPYICAEWESGGFPYWLHNYENLQVRRYNQVFLEKSENYLKKVYEIVKPRLVENGGNVLMMQIENEYGSFGKDDEYLQALLKIHEKYVPECIPFTSDGSEHELLQGGVIPGVLATANFGSKAEWNMDSLKSYCPNQPYMCMEFWCGWFDFWGGAHHVRAVEEKCECVEAFLKNGYSFNFYTFCGGTNFGFMNGTNILPDGEFQPTVTSYDYDAPLTEAGDRTPAYYAIRELIEKYVGSVPVLTATETKKQAYGKISFHACAPLFANLDRIGKTYRAEKPLLMEECKQAYGYLYYETQTTQTGALVFERLADRAILYCEESEGEVYMRQGFDEITTAVYPANSRLRILLENMGRINFREYMFDKKGIELSEKSVKTGEWQTVSLPMDNLDRLQFEPIRKPSTKEPAFYLSEFEIGEANDTFLKLSGFSKGFAVLNGFNLGRYFNAAGPTKTLYVPKSALKKGINRLIVFDSDGATELTAEFLAQPIL